MPKRSSRGASSRQSRSRSRGRVEASTTTDSGSRSGSPSRRGRPRSQSPSRTSKTTAKTAVAAPPSPTGRGRNTYDADYKPSSTVRSRKKSGTTVTDGHHGGKVPNGTQPLTVSVPKLNDSYGKKLRSSNASPPPRMGTPKINDSIFKNIQLTPSMKAKAHEFGTRAHEFGDKLHDKAYQFGDKFGVKAHQFGDKLHDKLASPIQAQASNFAVCRRKMKMAGQRYAAAMRRFLWRLRSSLPGWKATLLCLLLLATLAALAYIWLYHWESARGYYVVYEEVVRRKIIGKEGTEKQVEHHKEVHHHHKEL